MRGCNGSGSGDFSNNAVAADQTVFTIDGASVRVGFAEGLRFDNNSSASTSTFINEGGTAPGAYGGETIWSSTGSPGNSTFINNGATANSAFGGQTDFFIGVPLGNATLIANGGRGGSSSTTSGGEISLTENSGTARVEVFGNGRVLVADYFSPTIGSLEGNGLVELSPSILTVGTNNLSTTFSGVISGGSIIKVGKGKLTLASANTYTGGTTISRGSLFVTNKTGSATGTGTVTVKGGTLGGTGTISGPVTVGSGTSPGFLAPGNGGRLGTLNILGALAISPRATCQVNLNSTTVAADEVTGNGVTIGAGAQITLADLGTSTLPSGTVFTLINNTAATPIAGHFGNLADGATITVDNNTYLANYKGGDGNDLTLTVQ